MTNEEMLKTDLERAVKELGLDGQNTKQRVKYLLEECLEVYFKPKKYLTSAEVLKLSTENSYKVKQGDCVYEMILQDGIFERNIQLYREDDLVISDLYVSADMFTIYKYRNDFFNDLHLELVEE